MYIIYSARLRRPSAGSRLNWGSSAYPSSLATGLLVILRSSLTPPPGGSAATALYQRLDVSARCRIQMRLVNFKTAAVRPKGEFLSLGCIKKEIVKTFKGFCIFILERLNMKCATLHFLYDSPLEEMSHFILLVKGDGKLNYFIHCHLFCSILPKLIIKWNLKLSVWETWLQCLQQCINPVMHWPYQTDLSCSLFHLLPRLVSSSASEKHIHIPSKTTCRCIYFASLFNLCSYKYTQDVVCEHECVFSLLLLTVTHGQRF